MTNEFAQWFKTKSIILYLEPTCEAMLIIIQHFPLHPGIQQVLCELLQHHHQTIRVTILFTISVTLVMPCNNSININHCKYFILLPLHNPLERV